MLDAHKTSRLALALLATTMLTQTGPARAAPGDTLGPEFLVNTDAGGEQRFPAVAMDADGDFAVVWESYDGGGYSGLYGVYGIFAQRYDAAGTAQGPEFRVNTYIKDDQRRPAVAMDADGDFVVTWGSDGQDGSIYGVFAQRFDAAGVPQGPEFRVNSFTTERQWSPVVAMDADGDFVVAWQSRGQDGSLYGVFAQRFDAAGVAQGPEFQVNTFTTGGQQLPTMAMDADGDFVVAWQSSGQDGSDWGVFAQRFDAAGVAQGPEFRVNTLTTMRQFDPAVAMDADGDFVVAWTSADGSDVGIFAQRFDAAGAAEGFEFQVNTTTLNDQTRPSVAMDAGGGFVVAWQSRNQDGSSYGVFAQRYDAAGAAQGSEFQVNTVTTGQQFRPAIAMDNDGDFTAAWESYPPGGNLYDIVAQRYDGAERVEGDFDGDGNADVLWRNATTGAAVVWLMEGTEKLAAQSIGTVPLFWRVAGTGDFNGDGKTDVLWRHSDNGSTVIWQMDGLAKADSAGIGRPPLDWVVEQLRDTDGDGNSDIFWRNTTTGGTLVWRMSGFTRTIVGSPGAAGPEWQVQ